MCQTLTKITVLIIGLAGATLAMGEPTATAKETIDFINQKLGCTAEHRRDFKDDPKHYEFWTARTRVELSGDEIVMREERTSAMYSLYDDGPDTHVHVVDYIATSTYRARLRDLTTNVTSSDGNTFVVMCRSGYCIPRRGLLQYFCVKEDRGPFPCRRGEVTQENNINSKARSLFIMACDSDSKARLIKAFSHLIKISGGKDELF